MRDNDVTPDRPTASRAADGDGRLEEVLLHYFQAVDAGRPPDRRRLIERYPDLADELRDFFAEQDAADAQFGTAPAPTWPAAVGRCRLLGELGAGGMGAVYRGRDTDLHRDVAVKVLLERHRDKPELAKRFVEEARIAGQLQHPGVTPVYELGTFPDRRPYFSMKLVKGQTLAALLAARKDPAEDLTRYVGVFAQVCQAVAYAHARGVIHRDLKPANVMVGAFGEVQVMDWGLAKVLTPAAADETPVEEAGTWIHTGREAGAETGAGSVLGTPAYMAPEQARGEVAALDERCDVFGLGAVLCEVLTGRPAYTGGSGAEVYRKAKEGDTAEALVRLSGCGADVELVALAKQCLAVNPADRPRDAGAVAAAVTAYQESVTERLRQAELARAAEMARAEEAKATAAAERLARQLTVRLSAAVGLTLLLGVAGTTWGMMRANEAWLSEAEQKAEAVRAAAAEKKAKERETEQRRQAETARDNEARERGYAEAIGNFVKDDFLALTSFEGRVRFDGRTMTRNTTLRELLDRAATKLNTRKDLARPTEAELCWIIGVSYRGLGDAARAVPYLERSVKLHGEASGPESEATLDAQNSLAVACMAAGQYDRAVSLAEQTLTLWKGKVGPNHPHTLFSRNILANAYREAGRLDQAVPLAEQTLPLMKDRLGPNHPYTLYSMNNLAGAYRYAGRPDRAVPLLEQTLTLMKTNLGLDHYETLGAMNNLAIAYRSAGRPDRAVANAEEALNRRKAWLGSDHPETLTSMVTLAGAYRELGRLHQSTVLAEEASQLTKNRLGPDHPDTLISMVTLAESYQAIGKLNQAVPLFEEALRLRKAKLGPGHPHTLSSMANLALAYLDFGKLTQDSGMLTLGESLAQRSSALLKVKLGPDHPNTLASMNNLALAYSYVGKQDQALQLFKDTLQRGEERLGSDHPSTLRGMYNLAAAYRSAGKLEQALPLAEDTLTRSKDRLGRDHPDTLKAQAFLGISYRDAGRPDKALPHLEDALARARKQPGGIPASIAWIREQLASAYKDAGMPERALPLLIELLKIREAKDGPNDPKTLEALNNLAVVYWLAKQLDNSIPLFEKLWKQSEKINGPDHLDTLWCMANLGVNYRDAGRLKEAIPLLEKVHRGAKTNPVLRDQATLSLIGAYAKAGEGTKFATLVREQLPELRKGLPKGSPQLADQLVWIGHGYLELKKWAEAEPLLSECLAIRERLMPDLWKTFLTKSLLGGALLGQGKHAAAEPLLLAGYQGMKQREKTIPPIALSHLAEVAERLVQLYEATGQAEQAAEWRKKCAVKKPAGGS